MIKTEKNTSKAFLITIWRSLCKMLVVFIYLSASAHQPVYSVWLVSPKDKVILLDRLRLIKLVNSEHYSGEQNYR